MSTAQCQKCKHAKFKRKLAKSIQIYCTKHKEVKQMADVCEYFKKRGFGAGIYDLIMFIIMGI
jgi:hypothetical protein